MSSELSNDIEWRRKEAEIELKSLRSEIISAEQHGSVLYKWKLVLVAVLGAAGLGLSFGFGDTQRTAPSNFLLCFIPFVCLYVDLLSHHLVVRIVIVGTYLSYKGKAKVTFEQFAKVARSFNKRGKQVSGWKLLFKTFKTADVINLFDIDSLARYGSTIFLCITLMIYSCLTHSGAVGAEREISVHSPIWIGMSGFLGLCLTIYITFWRYKMREYYILTELEKEVSKGTEQIEPQEANPFSPSVSNR